MYSPEIFSPRRALAIAAAMVLTLVAAVQVQAANTISQVAPADLGSNSAVAMGVDGFPVTAHIALDVHGNTDALYVINCGKKECPANNTRRFVDHAYRVSRVQ